VTGWLVVACTAHRSYPTDVVPWVRSRLADATRWLRDQCGTTTAISGMARGGDLYWAQAALDAGLLLHAHVPYPQQADRWTRVERALWRSLLDRAAETVVYGDLDDVVAGGRSQAAARLLHARNDGMLAAAGAVVAVWEPARPRGGTWSVVRKAAVLGVPVVWLEPGARATRLPSAGELAEALRLGPVPALGVAGTTPRT
jgi:hypothetical protein